jgi:ABC-type lipoprotein release transport system permease subunit
MQFYLAFEIEFLAYRTLGVFLRTFALSLLACPTAAKRASLFPLAECFRHRSKEDQFERMGSVLGA